ncbi:MAG: hypothetical protein M3Q34_02325 [bacterium]|nr:hypothetical protein [bacterium]
MSLLGLGGLILFSFWWLGRALDNWKKEQDIKIDEIKNTVERIETYLEDKFD